VQEVEEHLRQAQGTRQTAAPFATQHLPNSGWQGSI